ncbi:MAG: hypothetical protein K2Y23_25440 [Cyanobacteria bacterium]|nr:hypothetical protein [Cyanobacteriota bacterium]
MHLTIEALPFGIAVASSIPVRENPMPRRAGMDFLSQPSPRLPHHAGPSAPVFAGASALFHVTLVALAFFFVSIRGTAAPATDARTVSRLDRPAMVFLVQPGLGTGGGGGGNRHAAPARHVQARGTDSMTVPAATIVAPAATPEVSPPIDTVVLDAKPLAAGSTYQFGVLEGALRAPIRFE